MSVYVTLQQCQNFATTKGGECLSLIKYENTMKKMEWMCADGHEWESAYNNIKRGQWCPTCASQMRALQDCKDFAATKGGECLTGEYKKSNIKMEWRCADGHEWEAKFNSIKHGGRWCPKCR